MIRIGISDMIKCTNLDGEKMNFGKYLIAEKAAENYLCDIKKIVYKFDIYATCCPATI